MPIAIACRAIPNSFDAFVTTAAAVSPVTHGGDVLQWLCGFAAESG